MSDNAAVPETALVVRVRNTVFSECETDRLKELLRYEAGRYRTVANMLHATAPERVNLERDAELLQRLSLALKDG